MKTILLTGANFVNRGAEAMLLTAIDNLKRIYPGSHFIVSSYSKAETSKAGQLFAGHNADVEFIKDPINLKKLLLQCCFTAFPFSGLRKRLTSHLASIKAFSHCDLVIDLSGFALSDRRPFTRRLVYVLEVLTACSLKKPFVAFTQAFGPFEKVSTKMFARLSLPRVSLLLVRGAKSLSNIKELGLKKLPPLKVCADSAFLFKAGNSSLPSSLLFPENLPVVGLSPNINISRTFTPEVQKTYFEALLAISRKITGEYNCNLVLFAHESGEGPKSDMFILENLSKSLGENPRVKFIRDGLNASALRDLISKLEFLVASRFHALVGAVSTATPFMAIAWAHKYFELAEEAGVPESVVDSQESCPGILERFSTLWEKRAGLRASLRDSRERLTVSANGAFEALERCNFLSK